MELTSFALGMLTMVAIAFAVVVVIGLLKVKKQEREIRNLHQGIDETRRDFHHDLQTWRTDLELEIKRVELECKSYTDSRLDKKFGLTGSKSQKENTLITS
jgi:predicted Holliday junction resolvase-like endonuclease